LADPPCMLVVLVVPVLAAPLPAELLDAGLPVPFVPPLVPFVPFVAGVDDPWVAGNTVIGVGGSGTGVDKTFASNSFSPVSDLFRSL